MTRLGEIFDIITSRVTLYAFIAALAAVIGRFGETYWLVDLFNHFQIYFLFIFSTAFLLNLLCKNWLHLPFVLLCALPSIYIVAHSELSLKPSATVDKNRQTYTLLFYNINSSLPLDPTVTNYIERTKADFVAIIELSNKLHSQLRMESLGYLYSHYALRKDNFGIGIYSKHPLINKQILSPDRWSPPSLSVEAVVDNQSINLLVAHTVPAMSPRGAAKRDHHIEFLAKASGALAKKQPTLLFGDFNVTPWAPIFKKFTTNTQMTDSRNGFGFHGSWPTFLPFGYIPIDHLFKSHHINLTSRTIGPNLGSDHFPIEVKFQISPKKPVTARNLLK